MLKKDRHIQGIESLISQGVEIKGQIFAQGSMRIDGSIEGQLDVKGDILTSTGSINGDVACATITVEEGGLLDGNFKMAKNAPETKNAREYDFKLGKTQEAKKH